MNTGLDAKKTASKKLVHKDAEAIGELIGKKVADAIAKSNNLKIVKPTYEIEENRRNVGQIIIPQKERKEILNELRQVL